jgi:osmoprotectant transport system ATP-binding protein
MIRLNGVSKSFDGGQSFAVREASLDIRTGETLVLLGSSGCGKTTTLKMINRLIEPDAGTIEVDGRDIRERGRNELRRSIGYVFQGIGLFPHMTVEQNVSIALRLIGRGRSAQRDRARQLMEVVGLDPDTFADRYPKHLSGGQQQRIGVARALATDPAYLLMDEPFGALDALTRDTLQQEIVRLKAELQKTIVFVTHDVFEAMTLADRIAVMHEGTVQQVGTIEELLAKSATPFVEDFFSRVRGQLDTFSGHFA